MNNQEEKIEIRLIQEWFSHVNSGVENLPILVIKNDSDLSFTLIQRLRKKIADSNLPNLKHVAVSSKTIKQIVGVNSIVIINNTDFIKTLHHKIIYISAKPAVIYFYNNIETCIHTKNINYDEIPKNLMEIKDPYEIISNPSKGR